MKSWDQLSLEDLDNFNDLVGDFSITNELCDDFIVDFKKEEEEEKKEEKKSDYYERFIKEYDDEP